MILRRMRACIVLLAAVVPLDGCGSRNFTVYKDGSSFYLTSDCSRRQRVLCDSGDIDRVVKDSGLPDSMQAGLKNGACTPGMGKRFLMGILEGMTAGQHAALKDAFRKNGYEINWVADS